MKKDFFDKMLEVMENPNVYLIFVGLGYPRLEEFLEKYPGRAINTEASEQTALDIAVGLAYSGKIPFVYTITPFFYRGWETIRTYIAHERLNVKLIGAGRDDDYSKEDGYTHDAQDIGKHLDLLEIEQLYPQNTSDVSEMIKWMLEVKEPQFLSLTR